MKIFKIGCIIGILFLMAADAGAQTNQELVNKAKAAAKAAREAADAIPDLCQRIPPDAAAIEARLREAEAAVAKAEKAASAIDPEKDANVIPKRAKLAQDQVDAAKAALTDAKNSGSGIAQKDKIRKYCERKQEEATGDREICEGMKGTIDAFLDEVIAKAEEQAKAHPCDSTAVRKAVEEFITKRYTDSNCEQLKGWIEDMFTNRKGDYYLPDNALVLFRASGTGATHGIVAYVTYYNPTDDTISLVLGPGLSPVYRNEQSHYLTGGEQVIVYPKSSATVGRKGWCTNKHLPAPSGEMNPEGWVSIPADYRLPANWAPETANGWKPNRHSQLVNPVSGAPLGYAIDINKHPEEALRFLHEVYQTLQPGVHDMIARGELQSDLMDDISFENFILEQSMWRITEDLSGGKHDFESYFVSMKPQFENATGVPYEKAPEKLQEEYKGVLTLNWSAVEYSGKKLKVLEDAP